MRIELLTAPAVEPITLDEAKLFLKVDTTADDALISEFIKAARIVAEEHTRRAFITQTVKISFEYKELKNPLELPFPPLQEVTEVAVTTPTSNSIISADDYSYEAGEQALLIYREAKEVWPLYDENGHLHVTYKCGYGDSADDVPTPIKTAIKMMIAHWYEYREAEEMPGEAEKILSRYRIWRF